MFINYETSHVAIYFTTKLSIKIIQELVKKYNLRFVVDPSVGRDLSHVYLKADTRESFNSFLSEYNKLEEQLKLQKERRKQSKFFLWSEYAKAFFKRAQTRMARV